jgi:hypothetical protein
LDTLGLVALWREGLLAKAVLEGKTKGYTKHPQLERFKSQKEPIAAINHYLWEVLVEAKKRVYKFDESTLKQIIDDCYCKYVNNNENKKLYDEIGNLLGLYSFIKDKPKLEPYVIIGNNILNNKLNKKLSKNKLKTNKKLLTKKISKKY